jgi:hypothetical protein
MMKNWISGLIGGGLCAVSAFLFAAAASAAPAQGSTAAVTPSRNAAPTTPDAGTSPLLCRTISSTGTRLRGQRVCMTREEWRRARTNR